MDTAVSRGQHCVASFFLCAMGSRDTNDSKGKGRCHPFAIYTKADITSSTLTAAT